MYATAPRVGVISAIIESVASEFDLRGIPGMTMKRGRWTLAVDRGNLLVPVRDRQRRIIAIIRRTDDESRRYLWCSTPDAPSGAPIHHAEPWNAEFRRALVITEGQLKSDTIAAILNITTIGLAGASSLPAGFAAMLRDEYPAVRSAFVAFDADAARNSHVAQARERLEASLIETGFRVHRVEWSEADAKGLDDYLTAQPTNGEAR